MGGFNQWYAALERAGSPAYAHLTTLAHELDQPIGQQGFTTTTDLLALARSMGLRAGQSMLDLCCGLGSPAACIAERLGCRVTGLDTATAGLRLAVARHGHEARFVVGDALHPPFHTASFDAVL